MQTEHLLILVLRFPAFNVSLIGLSNWESESIVVSQKLNLFAK